MIEIIGWVGGLLLSICGYPVAWQSYKDGHSKNVNMHFIWLWFWGEILFLIYTLVEFPTAYPLLANYAFNIILISIILKYRFYPKVK